MIIDNTNVDGNTALDNEIALYIIYFSMIVIDESFLVRVSVFSCKKTVQSCCRVNLNNGMMVII